VSRRPRRLWRWEACTAITSTMVYCYAAFFFFFYALGGFALINSRPIPAKRPAPCGDRSAPNISNKARGLATADAPEVLRFPLARNSLDERSSAAATDERSTGVSTPVAMTPVVVELITPPTASVAVTTRSKPS
jgi:hypothetical protein